MALAYSPLTIFLSATTLAPNPLPSTDITYVSTLWGFMTAISLATLLFGLSIICNAFFYDRDHGRCLYPRLQTLATLLDGRLEAVRRDQRFNETLCTSNKASRSGAVVHPGCIPRFYRSPPVNPAGDKKNALTKDSAAGPRSQAIGSQNPSVGITVHVVLGDARVATPTRNRIADPSLYSLPIMDDDWSPPPSPDLSSFPSQTQASFGVQWIETPSSTPSNLLHQNVSQS